MHKGTLLCINIDSILLPERFSLRLTPSAPIGKSHGILQSSLHLQFNEIQKASQGYLYIARIIAYF